MKKLLIFLISIVLFCGCKINGYNAEDGTFLAGNGYYLNKKYICDSLYLVSDENSLLDNISKPCIVLKWQDKDGLLQNPAFCSCENYSFQILNYVVRSQKEKRIGSDLLNNSILEFTLYPEEGEPIKVDSSGAVWNEGGKNTWFEFTVDFDNKKFIPNQLL